VLADAGARARCRVTRVDADLRTSWPAALRDAGHDAGRPTAWLVEGCLFYLPSAVAEGILDGVTALSPESSVVGFDIVNAAVLASPWTKAWIDMQAAAGAPWIGTMEDPVGFMGARGWDATMTQPGQPDADHGRWGLPVIPPTMPDVPHNWYVTAERVG
jgi:methyltransferase (TIGR00027 family)